MSDGGIPHPSPMIRWMREREELAGELTAMVRHSEEMREQDASAGDLLEDLEERLANVVARLCGQGERPFTPHYPMEGE